MSSRIDCPHCDKPYKVRGINTHIGRVHPEAKRVTIQMGEDEPTMAMRTLVTVKEHEPPQEVVEDSDSKPIPTAEGATYTKWQRIKVWWKNLSIVDCPGCGDRTHISRLHKETKTCYDCYENKG